MNSDAGRGAEEAYVWVWLPGRTEPVVAGRLARAGGTLQFHYGRSYLDRADAVPLYEPELPLKPGVLPLPAGLTMPGCLRDASPDAWGRRVIINRLLGPAGRDTDAAVLDEFTYMLASGSDRTGALDFQPSPTEYVPRDMRQASLEELLESAERVEKGQPLSKELAEALNHGTSIGGARPKATITDGNRKLIAKFSSSSDTYSVVKAEYIAMRLAAWAGLEVAPVELVRASGRDVLLVERFDRHRRVDGAWERRGMVSALTLLELDEMMAPYASYQDLADIVRHRFQHPKASLKELFGRLVFNVLCGNTDDHARNHAAFWNGKALALTPAYDICPQNRTGNEATQGMLIHDQSRFSQLAVCLEAAQQFLLCEAEAREIINRQLDTLRTQWRAVCDEAGLTEIDRNLFWGRQFLNPFSLEGYRES